jgi:hypothetical protein
LIYVCLSACVHARICVCVDKHSIRMLYLCLVVPEIILVPYLCHVIPAIIHTHAVARVGALVWVPPPSYIMQHLYYIHPFYRYTGIQLQQRKYVQGCAKLWPPNERTAPTSNYLQTIVSPKIYQLKLELSASLQSSDSFAPTQPT